MFEEAAGIHQLRLHDSIAVDIDLNPDDLAQVTKRSDEMGLVELGRYIEKVEREGYGATRYRVDYHGKIAAPFVCLFLSVLGTAIALRGKLREGVPVSISYGLGIAFLYWIFNSFCLSLGYAEMMPPVISAWVANLVFYMHCRLFNAQCKLRGRCMAYTLRPDFRVSSMIIGYNLVMVLVIVLFWPIWVPVIGFRKKHRRSFLKRLYMDPLSGNDTEPDRSVARIWIHALSVGEVLSAEPLVKALSRKHGARALVFTASTQTGFETATRVIAPHVETVETFSLRYRLFRQSRAEYHQPTAGGDRGN